MARETVQDLIIRIKEEGLGNLEFLRKELKQVSSESKIAEGSINKLQKEIKDFGAATKQSTVGLKGQIAAFEKLRAQSNFQGQAYKSLTKDLVALNNELKTRAGIEKQIDAGKEAAKRRRGGSYSIGSDSDAAWLSSKAAAAPTTEKAFADRMATLQAMLVTRTYQNITDKQREFFTKFRPDTTSGLYNMLDVKGSADAFKKIIFDSNVAYREIEAREGKGKGRHTFNNSVLMNQGELNETQLAALNIQNELNITSKRYVDLLVKINAETGKNNRQLGARDAEVANREAIARAEVIRTTDLTRQQEARAKQYLYSTDRALYGSQAGGISSTEQGTYFGGKGMGPATRDFQAKMKGAQWFQQIVGLIPEWRSPTLKAALAEQADHRKPYLKDFRKDRTDISQKFPSFMDWQKTGYGQLPKGMAYSKLVRTTMGEGIQHTIKDPLGLGLNPKYPRTEFGLGQEMKQLAEMLPHLENATKPWLTVVEKIEEKQKEINKLVKEGTDAIEARRKKIAKLETIPNLTPKPGQKLLPPGVPSVRLGLHTLKETESKFDTRKISREMKKASKSADDLRRSILKQTSASGKSINKLNEQRTSLERLRNSVAPNSSVFKQLTKDIDRTTKSLDKLQGKSKGFGKKGLLGFGQSVLGGAYFGGPFGALGAGIGQMFGGQQGAATGGLVGAQVGRPITEFIGGSTDYAAQYSKAQLTLEQITKDAGSYGVAMEAVKTAVEDYNVPQEVAIKGMTRLSAAVLGSGGNINNAAEAFLNTTAAIKGTAGSADDVRSAITAMVQIYSKGKVSAEELSGQLGERFPGAVTKFAKANDISTQSLQKALKEGKVGLDMLSKFVESLGTEYAGLAKKISGSPEEAGARARIAMNKLRIAVGEELIPIGKEFQEIGANILIDLVPALTKVAEIGGNVFFGFSQVVKAIADNFDVLAPAITTATVAFVAYNLQLQIANRTGIILMFRNLLALLIRIRRTIVLATVSMEAFNIAMKKNKWAMIATAIATVGTSIWAVIDAQNALKDEKGILGDITGMNLEETEAKLESVKKKIKDLQAQIADENTTIPERRGLNKLITQYKDAVLELQTQITKLGGKVVFDPITEGAEDAGEAIYEGLSGGVNKFMDSMKKSGEELANVTASWFDRMASSLADFVMTGKLKFKEFARSVIADIAKMIAKQLIFNMIAGLDMGNWGKFRLGRNSAMNRSKDLPLMKGANGLVFAQNGIVPYAKGGIVDKPTYFPFAKGVGLMGEAGPEAIVPLKRGKDGKLGIAGGSGDTVVNISVDAKGTSVEGQDTQAKMLGKMLSTAVQAEIARQKRPGGILS